MYLRLAVLVLAVLSVGACTRSMSPTVTSTIETSDFLERPLHYAAYGKADFYPTLVASDQPEALTEKVYGGIVSHHFYAEPYIARFFSALREQPLQTVVVIGPNHYFAGASDILVSAGSYATPWGVLENDSVITQQLVSGRVGQYEEVPFEREHSISTLVGFIKHTAPDARIVPIIIKRGTKQEDLEALVERLSDILPEESLVLASVDFSHHLNRFGANFHDQLSTSALAAGEVDRMSTLEADSPEALEVLLRYLATRGAYRGIFTRTDSSLLGRILDSNDVTSYVFAHFFRGEAVPNSSFSLLTFGDMMFDREVAEFIEHGGDPFAHIVGPEGNFFRGVDAIVANLEGPITRTQSCQNTAYSFSFDPGVAELLARAGISTVTVGNNHSADCGMQGLTDTMRYLNAERIALFGSAELEKPYVVLRRGDMQIAMIGFDALQVSQAQLQKFYESIRSLASEVDRVIVHIHWGIEYDHLPSSDQKKIAREIISYGADAIIGHHPHVIQPFELIDGKPVFYSLGNFIFDQVPPETREGLGVGLFFEDNAYGMPETSVYLFPFISENYQPKLLNASDAARWCDAYLAEIVAGKDGCKVTAN